MTTEVRVLNTDPPGKSLRPSLCLSVVCVLLSVFCGPATDAQPRLCAIQLFRDGCAQERKHDLVVTRNLVALSTAERWSLHDIDVWAVVPHEIHIHGDQVGDRLSHIASEVERFDERFGDDD